MLSAHEWPELEKRMGIGAAEKEGRNSPLQNNSLASMDPIMGLRPQQCTTQGKMYGRAIIRGKDMGEIVPPRTRLQASHWSLEESSTAICGRTISKDVGLGVDCTRYCEEVCEA